METNQILMLVGLIVVGYLILKFIWGAAKGIIKLALVVIILGAGAYIIKPELLYNVFGKENVEAVAKDGIEKASEAADTIPKKVEEKVDDVVTN